MPLTRFHPVLARWFERRFGAPTEVQARSWPVIAEGRPVLIAAPTGSGKTLAAFLACIDRLVRLAAARELEDRTQILYVSPLKALSNDIQKNLQQPLNEIREAALADGLLLPEIRVTVRTGDTPAWDRQQMLRRPPHILITTPESLYLVLTAEKSRRILRDVKAVIVDEIHAVAPSKRGSHLALSLERLEALTPAPPQRIGLSATQRPIERLAEFLMGARERSACRIIDVGHRRPMDLAVEVPNDELGAVATNAMWSDIYARLAALVREHQSTLVFVNTRRLVERVAHGLEERLQDLGGQVVAAHHGSLSRAIRLSAEERLKRGQTRVVVATASLELGIDVGTVDLVCQIGSPRAIAACLQRVGRSGHWVGAVPKGRLFATTRDQLLECAALVLAIRSGTLDCIEIPAEPLDILAQQMVAAAATQEWTEQDLFALCRRAYPYRDLSRSTFDDVLRMLSEGIATNRGRGHAYLHHDRINRRVRARRGARLAALTSGGAIPETANYAVVAEPEGTVVGSVDEDFAVESLSGDIMLLGNTSWRIRGIEMGKVRVEDAHGAPPTIPFWRGEAPARTAELSAQVAALRERLAGMTDAPAGSGPPHPARVLWLQRECGLDRQGAEQALQYVEAGRAVLGAVPTQERIVAERFFDEGGGMQLVLHTPFGGRINRAWGLALRKRFCTTFDFELQAAATDDGIVISLGERHSFPLETVFGFVRSESLPELLTGAVLQAPMFTTRWRWNVTRALAVLRFSGGRRVPPQIQRMRSEDLLAAVFPDAVACQDNLHGDRAERRIPDHPLVRETLRDCLTEAMDLDGLTAVLRRIESGAIHCVAIDTPAPSVFSHEILNANPYAFLDDAPLEERRARAVEMRRTLPPDLAGSVGALDPAAIAEVSGQAWPLVRDPDELHDALLTLLWVPVDQSSEWRTWLPPLVQSGRAVEAAIGTGERSGSNRRGWIAAERLALVTAVFPEIQSQVTTPDDAGGTAVPEREEAVAAIVQGWMESIGPTTAAELAARLGLGESEVRSALLRWEASGQVLRGRFRASQSDQEEWCDRRLLARIHRLTLGKLRREIEPVTAAEFMQFLFRWQHVAPGSRLHGEAGGVDIIRQLAGFEAGASAWEGHLLPVRLAKYQPEVLDRLCLGGIVMWGRLTPPSPLMESDGEGRGRPRRLAPSSVAPIALFPREDAPWLSFAFGGGQARPEPAGGRVLGGPAQDVLAHLKHHGATFFADLERGTKRLASEVEDGLWELVTAGLVTADGFDNLRALLDPRRRRAEGRDRHRRPRHVAGRWSLLPHSVHSPASDTAAVAEQAARQLLRRYGVVFRDLLGRESLAVTWRDLLVQYRKMELRGDVRGGRFVGGFTGEQFALPEAVESLRVGRNSTIAGEVKICAADPLNLVGVILPGARVPALPTNFVVFREGVPVRTGQFRQEVREPQGEAAGDERPASARSQ